MGCTQNPQSPPSQNVEPQGPGGDAQGGGANGGSTRGGSVSAPKTSTGGLYDNYQLGPKLGEGAYGAVYACGRKGSNDYPYAVKMVDKVEAPLNDIKREIAMLQKLQHENVVVFHDAFFEKVAVAIVMDKYGGGDLIEGMQAHWKSEGKIPCAKAVHVTRQMARAVHHLHSCNVVHRDVKGDNYLMDRKNIADPELKVLMSDFGTALEIKPLERLKASLGTRIYWPPEFYDGNYSFKVDIWALGVIVFGLLEGRFPFKNEQAVRKQNLRMPSNANASCQDFIKKLLTKDEKERPGSEAMMNHPWIKDVVAAASADVSKQAFSPGEEPEKLREGGANAGVAERRKELIERLENKAKGTRAANNMSIFWQQRFAVQNRITQKEMRYEWWSKDKVESEKLIDMNNAAIGPSAAEGAKDNSIVLQMLRDHSIDISEWGTGQARSFDQFAAEVHSGAVALMLDATEHKKLVRVSDVVLLRISFEDAGTMRYLIEDSEKLEDGRTRPDLHRLPGTKKEPHENSKRTTERIVTAMLGMTDCKITWDFEAKEIFEEQEESLSYPGVTTVYRKEIIPGKVTVTDAAVLQRVGLQQGGGTFRYTDTHSLTKDFGWYTEPVCQDKGVKLRAPAEGDDISGIVQAPIGFGEEELREYLAKSGVDISAFGQDHNKSLKEFSNELLKGESSIMVKPEGDVVRVVDVVLLRLMKQGEEKILVELEEKHSDGTVKKLHRFPGAKRRPDENQFLTAQRVLKRYLKMDENYVTINAQDVVVLEEEKDSASYPGLRTLYRKRIISAELQRSLG